tara:strand:- start:3714 stop:4907 length:1194 start_codon:yes stop_codon:yes gene_type:complete
MPDSVIDQTKKKLGENINAFIKDQDSSNLYSIVAIMMIISILLLFFSWFVSILNLQDTNCDNYKYNFSRLNSFNSIKYNKLPLITNIETDYNNPYKSLFKNFYIKTAYNCCNAGGYKNNWVNICAMKYALKLGARCLDFEIYSIENMPVVASSVNMNFSIKETFNYLTLEEVLDVIVNGDGEEFSGAFGNLNKDPLILHFRIKSENKKMYENMTILLTKKLLNTGYLINNNDIDRSNIQIIPLTLKKNSGLTSNLSEKIVLMANVNNTSLLNQSGLNELINICSGVESNLISIDNINSKNDTLIKNQSKNKIIFVTPSFKNDTQNYDFTNAYTNGCQLIAMKFQNYDNNLVNYLKLFKEHSQGYSFCLKHSTLRKDLIPPDAPVTGVASTSITSPTG